MCGAKERYNAFAEDCITQTLKEDMDSAEAETDDGPTPISQDLAWDEEGEIPSEDEEVVVQRSRKPILMTAGSLTVEGTVTGRHFLEALRQLASEVFPWNPANYLKLKTLERAQANFGSVLLMEEMSSKELIAVKKMPTHYVQGNHTEFMAKYPSAHEKPWADMAFVKILNAHRYPYAVRLLGVFQDMHSTYVASSLATGGDLLAWANSSAMPIGLEREDQVLSLVVEVFTAVRMLHNLGIAHLDISLENIVLTDEGSIRLIDFCVATTSRVIFPSVKFGKPEYRAPEMSGEKTECDAFLVDAFALGVTVFILASGNYPWKAARTKCQKFRFFAEHGLSRFLEDDFHGFDSLDGPDALADMLSAELKELLDVLLRILPNERFCLGETCYRRDSNFRGSVWDLPWLKSSHGNPFHVGL
eukprot:TRINITY_DN63632_c0_g1_i1.p1 TRINITY_DN63632_c0_g1~~TRINITY_DN63632_c0_g1_i1.p1  ORF type:complete len:417 (+),score=75.21 TRINITY_DN63632_c0_g1_i1:183-1433(+)